MLELDRIHYPGEVHEGDYFNLSRISKRLRELRTEKGLTQQQLADEIEVSQQLIRNYEAAGEKNGGNKIQQSVAGMKIETLYKLGKYFGVSADYILCRTDIREASTKIRDIRKYLGLEEEAIKVLHQNADSNGMAFLNRLLSNDSFLNSLFDVEVTTLWANLDILPDQIKHYRAFGSEKDMAQVVIESSIIQAGLEFNKILKELAREIMQHDKEKKVVE